MSRERTSQFTPDYAGHPGQSIEEMLEYIGMSQRELAERSSRPLKTINEIIHGKASLTAETALQFERVLGVPARMWINYERNYREHLARAEERERLAGSIEWLREIPYTTMVSFDWVEKQTDPIAQIQALLNFFAVATPRPWSELCPGAAFRNAEAFESNPASVAAWLRKGEILARGISCEKYDATRLKSALLSLRALALAAPEIFIPTMIRTCAQCGVAFVLLQELQALVYLVQLAG